MKRFLVICLVCLSLVAFSGTAMAISVTPTNDANVLVNTILGSGITVSNITYNGVLTIGPTPGGTFTDGSVIGIESGILLTSGDAALVTSTNTSDGATGVTGLGGDPDLAALVPETTTYDALVLEFDFESAGGDVFFNYSFGSEEYNEYVNSPYNDVFGFFLDGVNIALLPDGVTEVSVNTVNGGNPFGTNATNPEFYNNNDPNDPGPATFAIEYDGFTDVFTAQGLGLAPGTHHIKLAIADTSDNILDSGVFIQEGSFSDQPTIPEPATMLLLGTGLVGLAGLRRRFRA